MTVAKCKKRRDKESIMENKKKLRGERIFIDNDLTQNKRRVREKVVNLAKQIIQGKRAKIGFKRVIG